MTLSQNALSFLRWIRDNQHHYSAWMPHYAGPEKCTHLYISNSKASKKTAVSMIEEAKPYFRPANYERTQRMFEPTEEGMAMLGGEV